MKEGRTEESISAQGSGVPREAPAPGSLGLRTLSPAQPRSLTYGTLKEKLNEPLLRGGPAGIWESEDRVSREGGGRGRTENNSLSRL